MLTNEPKLIGQICDFIRRRTDAPDTFIQAGAMTVLAALIGKKVCIDFAGKQLTPCIWTVIIGRSSHLRKSTVLELCSTLIQRSSPDNTLVMLPQTCSLEGMLKSLDRGDAAEPVRHTGCLIHNEFAVFLQTVKKKYNTGMSETLTDIFDVPHSVSRETVSGGRITLKRPCITFLAATTADWLSSGLDQTDLLSGFIPRFLFIPCSERTRNLDFPDVGWNGDGDALVEELARIHALSGTLAVSMDAIEAYKAHTARAEAIAAASTRPEMHAFHTRLNIVVLKFAVIHTVACGKQEIDGECLTWASAAVNAIRDTMEQTVTEDMAFTRQEKSRAAVVRYIRNSGGRAKHSDVLRASRLNIRQFSAVIDTLIGGCVIQSFKRGRGKYYCLYGTNAKEVAEYGSIDRHRTPQAGTTGPHQ